MLTRWLFAVLSCISAVGSQEPAVSEPGSGKSVQPAIYTQVRNGEVLYVSGPDLVLRLENGRVAHFFLPQPAKFNVDGQSIPLDELKPGMRLTETIATRYAPELSVPASSQNAPTPASAMPVQAARPSPRLPETATPLPLVSLAGLGALLTGWVVRKRREHG